LIKAKHNWFARTLFTGYIDRLLKKHFSNFYLVNEVPNDIADHTVVVTPNHISWWDGFFIDKVNRHCINKKFHIMMLQEQLERFWFFKYLGAYSIIPENSKSVIETAGYTREILKSFNNTVTIYPQGKIEPFDLDEVTLKEGLKIFIGKENNNVKVLPIGFKIQYYEEKLPSILTRFGSVLDASDVINDFPKYAEFFTNNLKQLKLDSHKQNFYIDLFKK
jgi:1-acyl-sn-glycerol-3-phosphate acyltransferase